MTNDACDSCWFVAIDWPCLECVMPDHCPTCSFWKRKGRNYGMCFHPGPWHQQLIMETFGCEDHEPKVERTDRTADQRDRDADLGNRDAGVRVGEIL